MQRGQHEVAGVGRAHGGGEGKGVAHFSDHDHVGILPERGLERSAEGGRVQAHLALLDDRLVVLEDELDGIFQRDNVLPEVGVDVLKHGRERRRFPRTGGACDQHDAALGFRDLEGDFHEAELFEGRHLGLDQTKSQGPGPALLEDVGAESADAGNEVGEVRLTVGIESDAVVRRHDLLDHAVHPFLCRERRLHVDELAVDAEDHGSAGLHVDVGGAALHGRLEDLVKDFHG